jgi:hypothetical protein
MKAVGTFKHADGAFEAVDALSQADVYATIAGNQRDGYEVLVRESQLDAAEQALRTANEKDAAQPSPAGGNA